MLLMDVSINSVILAEINSEQYKYTLNFCKGIKKEILTHALFIFYWFNSLQLCFEVVD